MRFIILTLIAIFQVDSSIGKCLKCHIPKSSLWLGTYLPRYCNWISLGKEFSFDSGTDVAL